MEGDNLEDLDIDGDNMKMDLKDAGWGGTDWIALAQHTERWRALVNAVINFRVPENVGNLLTS
jgi:hypothetical protein